MSATIKAQVLAKAVELWADPKRRTKGKYEGRHHGEVTYCALGVLMKAHEAVTGIAVGDSMFFDFSKMLGFEYPSEVLMLNDDVKGGQKQLYARMQDALAKELA